MYSDLLLYPRYLKQEGKPYYFAPGHPDRLEEERRAKLRKRRARSEPKAKDRPARTTNQPRMF